MPQRIQLRRTKGWRKPEGAVVVARPTKWGNPYRVVQPPASWLYKPGKWCVQGDDGCRYTDFDSQEEATAWAVDRFRMAIEHDRQYGRNVLRFRHADLADLQGRDLACWCPLEDDQGRRVPCHADVLLEMSNVEAGGPDG